MSLNSSSGLIKAMQERLGCSCMPYKASPFATEDLRLPLDKRIFVM